METAVHKKNHVTSSPNDDEHFERFRKGLREQTPEQTLASLKVYRENLKNRLTASLTAWSCEHIDELKRIEEEARKRLAK